MARTKEDHIALNHWTAVHQQHRDIVDFIEWLEERGLEIAIADCDEAAASFPTLDQLKPERLVDAYLEVDRRALDKARRALLQENREMVND